MKKFRIVYYLKDCFVSDLLDFADYKDAKTYINNEFSTGMIQVLGGKLHLIPAGSIERITIQDNDEYLKECEETDDVPF